MVYTHVLNIAKGELGVKEKAGDEENPRILEYHSTTLLKATKDEIPWCASFVCWCLQTAGLQHTKSAAADSYLRFGRELKKPVRGCLVVLDRGEGRCHVGFFLVEHNSTISVLGGNQRDGVTIAYFLKEHVLSYRAYELIGLSGGNLGKQDMDRV